MSFELLPTELQQLIVESLPLHPPEGGETKPVAFDQIRLPDEPWFKFTRNRAALRNLCRVSSILRDIAHPLLYRTVTIWTEEAMLLLLRTYVEHPEYGRHARYLASHLTLTDEQTFKEVLLCCHRFWSPTMKDVMGEHHTDAMRQLSVVMGIAGTRKLRFREQEELPQMILAAILSLTPNVETFLCQLPLLGKQLDYDALIDAFAPAPNAMAANNFDPFAETAMDVDPPSDAETEDPLDTGFGTRWPIGASKTRETFAAAMQSQLSQRQPGRLLPNVTKLLFQADPERLATEEARRLGWPHVHDAEEPEAARPGYYWPIYMACPKLETLEFTRDDGMWIADDVQAVMEETVRLSWVRELYLSNSLSTPKDLCDILLTFPRLELLYMSAEEWCPSPAHDETENDEVLDESLTKYGKHLRQLDLGWWSCMECLPEIGEEGILTCLPKLTHMWELSIQMNLLYRDSRARTLLAGGQLVDLLPPNLTHLRLEEWWWTWAELDPLPQAIVTSNYTGAPPAGMQTVIDRYHGLADYRNAIVVLLTGLASLVGGDRMPRLKKVVYSIRVPQHWLPPTNVWPRATASKMKLEDLHQFTPLMSLFASKGIEFNVGEA
jgi:hypothetical protein